MGLTWLQWFAMLGVGQFFLLRSGGFLTGLLQIIILAISGGFLYLSVPAGQEGMVIGAIFVIVIISVFT